MQSYTITIPFSPPSLNSWQRAHWSVQRTIREDWAQAVWALCHQAKIPQLDKAHVSACLYFPTRRRRDLDNYQVVYKILLDALVRARILPDDDLEHVTISPVTIEIGGPCTVVTISCQ